MNEPVLKKVEETYLKIFRIVLLVVLTIILAATLYIGGQGAMQLLGSPKPVEPAKTAPPPEISVDKFLERFDEKPVEEPPPSKSPEAPPKKDTTLDDKVSAQIGKLWAHYDKYQTACRIDPRIRVDRSAFERDFNRQVFRNLLEELGDEYFISQDKFQKALLEHPRVIQICIENQGRAGIFFSSLNWHRQEWWEQETEAEDFNQSEKQRFESETQAEDMRVAAEKVAGTAKLILAAQIFAAFMALALLLIFAKIESNLRGVEIIHKRPDDPAE